METLEDRRNTMRKRTAEMLEADRRKSGCPRSNDENWIDACRIVDAVIEARKERIDGKGVS